MRCAAWLLWCWASLFAWSAQGDVAPVWDGQQFNYQLSQTFTMANQISGVKVYFVDMESTAAKTVSDMRAAGLIPVCYFSTQYEDWRADADQFDADVLGNPLDNWPGERWVDIRSTNVRSIMKQRIKQCADKGFLAIDPDNTDGYTFPGPGTGFPLTAKDTLGFLTFLSEEARALGLGTGLKNTLGLISPNTVRLWHFAVSEQCYQYNECGLYAPFKAAGKPIFNIEYTLQTSFFANICPKTASFGTTSIRKTLALKALPWDACDPPTPPSPKPSTASPSPKPPTASPSPAPPPTGCVQQKVAVPAYFNPCFSPTCSFQRMTGNAALAVFGPDSGPGNRQFPGYVRIVDEMKAAGMVVLAYIYTKTGNRAIASVKADIDKYYAWYGGISGIFIDEGSNNCARLPYYQELVSYIKGKDSTAVVALNWGTNGPECYLASPNAPDILLTFEASYADYIGGEDFVQEAWTEKYPADRFWHLVHGTPANRNAYGRALALSRQRRAGWVYVTSDVMPNPWDTIPSKALWAYEVQTVAGNSVC